MPKIGRIIIILLITVCSVIGFFLLKNTSLAITTVSAIGGWLLLLVYVLYRNWNRFHMLIQKIRYALVNPDTLWSLTVRYSGQNFKENILEEIRSIFIKNENSNDFKIEQPLFSVIRISSNGLNVEFIKESDHELVVNILDLPVRYKKVDTVMANILSPIFKELESKLSLNSKDYQLNVKFNTMNPFYNVYISKVGIKNIVDFNVNFLIDNQHVEMGKNRLTFRTNSIDQLVKRSKDLSAIAP